ncbi:MAG: GspH/FimT family pseudopilin [Deltaproteobacteria bacterium]|nr:GspH/FimT family pseudopilin [Candidatus Anaeroferrophillacea bacterium]
MTSPQFTTGTTVPTAARPDAGFTIVELMVTVAVIAIIAGFTFGNMNTASYKLRTAARTLKANMQKARLLAVKENCPVYLDFDFNDDSTLDRGYTLWRDINGNGAYDDATTDNNGDGVTNADDEELVETVTIQDTIGYGHVAAADGGPAPIGASFDDGVTYGSDQVRFSPSGTSSSGFIYVHIPQNDEAGTHAVGTNNIGRVRSAYKATGTDPDDWR